jgi:glycerate kinase
MRVLAAFDKFKGSLPAARACTVAADAIAAVRPGWDVDRCPLADGGEGFARILTAAASGTMVGIRATRPDGRRIRADFGVVSLGKIPKAARALLGLGRSAGGEVGVVEMAAASGLALVPQKDRDPWRSISSGTGQLIRAAADAGVRAIVLGVGGSATHDLGLGALGELGIVFEGKSGRSLAPITPGKWPKVIRLGGSLGRGLPPILIACDVDNPLAGPRGAARTYGPQKGLDPRTAARLDRETVRMAGLMCRHFRRPPSLMSRPGAGAAGGIAFGLMAAAGAALIPGFGLVAAWLELEPRLRAADVVLTGEGRFDDTSFRGKGPGAVVNRCLALGKRVHVFAGSVSLRRAQPGVEAHAITPPGMILGEAVRRAPTLLSQSVRRAFERG